MGWIELINLTKVALELDKKADTYGILGCPKTYYALRSTAKEIHKLVQTELKQKRS